MTGVGEEPFICICADGFGGDTCNLTETGRAEKENSGGKARKHVPKLTPFFLHLQDLAVPTPARTMGPARSSLRPDEEMFSMSTSASASPALRECTARSVSYFWLWVKSLNWTLFVLCIYRTTCCTPRGHLTPYSMNFKTISGHLMLT